MTNAEKYLKDGVDINELLNDFGEMYADNELQKGVLMLGIKNFFEAEVKSTKTLTEDERVILRNTKKDYAKIVRDETGAIYFKCDNIGTRGIFSDLFQFIKERRRI